MDNKLKDLTVAYLKDIQNFETNWDMALHYETIGQFASAISFYVRAAERADDKLLQYECMVRAAICFMHQGIRKFSVKSMLQHAVSLIPDRPEAYYHLCTILNNEWGDGSWFDSYTYSTLGLTVTKDVDQLPKMRTNLEYPGRIGMEFQQAHSAWHCGMCEESRDLHRDLYLREDLPEDLKVVVKNNLQTMNAFQTEKIQPFTMIHTSYLKHQFVGVDKIDKNFSESFQDMFVLTMLEGKTKGTYLEIGAGDAWYGNNTALLEKHFEWQGLSIDLDEKFVEQHNNERNHICLRRDATNTDYDKLLTAMDMPTEIDYLQVDCDPPENSFKALLNIPFEKYKFAVITFEHDHYADPDSKIRTKSRKYLQSHGYELVAGNIAPDDWREYEDWYVHPDLVDSKKIEKMKQDTDSVKKAFEYMVPHYEQ